MSRATRLFAAGALTILGTPMAFALDNQQQEIDAEPTRLNRVQPVQVPEPKSKTATVPAPNPADPAAAPSLDGKWTFGGAIRTRYDAQFSATNAKTGAPDTRQYFGLDTLILKATYDSSTLYGAAQYRIYGGAFPYDHNNGYKQYFGEFSFLRFAYAGYKLTPEDSISAGLQQVPFGLVPYFSTAFRETLGYDAGIEEVYNVGIQYAHVEKDYNYQFGYFPVDGGNYFGISRDSARYTTNIVRADSYVANASDNVERNILVARGEYTFYRDAHASATLGGSIWHSSIFNYDTRQYGSKQLEALHFTGTYDAWTFRTIGSRIDIDPRNPGGRNSLITVGNFDGSYNMATRGYFLSSELAYKIEPGSGLFTQVVPFFNYSRYFKDKAGYRDSERYTFGAAWSFRDIKGLEVATEMRIGRNDPETGSGQFTQGLGAGGDNKYKSAFYVNIGYYF